MDILEHDSRIVQAVLLEHGRIPFAYGNLEIVPVFDCVRHHYLMLIVGWLNDECNHEILNHVDLIGDRVWIQRDGTEEGIALELEQAGIPKERIVLGFHPDWKRPMTSYAVA